MHSSFSGSFSNLPLQPGQSIFHMLSHTSYMLLIAFAILYGSFFMYLVWNFHFKRWLHVNFTDTFIQNEQNATHWIHYVCFTNFFVSFCVYIWFFCHLYKLHFTWYSNNKSNNAFCKFEWHCNFSHINIQLVGQNQNINFRNQMMWSSKYSLRNIWA